MAAMIWVHGNYHLSSTHPMMGLFTLASWHKSFVSSIIMGCYSRNFIWIGEHRCSEWSANINRVRAKYLETRPKISVYAAIPVRLYLVSGVLLFYISRNKLLVQWIRLTRSFMFFDIFSPTNNINAVKSTFNYLVLKSPTMLVIISQYQWCPLHSYQYRTWHKTQAMPPKKITYENLI